MNANALMSLDDALQHLLATVSPLNQPENLAAERCLGRVLAQDVVSALDVPPADNSAMDGYALRCADVGEADGATLPIHQRLAAGQWPEPLQPGSAARIFTGAVIPPGADAVVMQEHTEPVEGGVRFLAEPKPGQNIRRQGEDVRTGSVVLTQGLRLTPAALGMAATVGLTHLRVARAPRVALFSTGDELTAPGQSLPRGGIYNSNRSTLAALIRAAGGECADLGIVPDRLDLTQAALREASKGHDLIVSSGGVSVGEEDHLKAAIQAEGELKLWKLAIKPGKPLAFGRVNRAGQGEAAPCWVMGLPGNPVSSFVTFLLLVRPVLLRLQGAAQCTPQPLPMRADFAWPRADARREFLRVRRNAQGGLDLFPHQGSGVLTSAVWADGLVDTAPGQTIQPGDVVRYLPFEGWF
jgi:molybdopterin molybdotransferase